MAVHHQLGLYPLGYAQNNQIFLDIPIVNASIYTNMNDTISISQLRQDATNIINQTVAKQRPTVILQRSKPKAVLVDYDYFQSLEQALLDAGDAAEAERAKQEKEPAISLEDYIEKRFGGSL